MSSIDIDSSGVIQVILQYLKENNLTESYKALSNEARVSTNIISNKELFVSSIVNGKWDYVLEQVSMLKLPDSVMSDLYEQVFYELLEIREVYTAREMLAHCEPLIKMQTEQRERYLQMDYWLKKHYFDPIEAFTAGETKESRRQRIASVISSYLSIAPSSRLLQLLQQAMNYEKEKGILVEGERLNLFTNCAESIELVDAVPTGPKVQFPKGAYPETVAISPNGQYVVSGSADGFIEVWDIEKGSLKVDLAYQKEEHFMMHNTSVLSLSFSCDSEFLVSGDLEGTIKVWRVSNGALVRKFVKVHENGVTTVCFNNSNQQICSGSFDGTVRIHGLKGGKTLKVMRGHTSYVNSVVYSVDEQQVISASSDGSLRVWDVATTNCIRVIQPAKIDGSYADIAIMSILPLIQNPDYLLVIPKLNKAYVMSKSGAIVYSMKTDKSESLFVAGCLSPHGKYVYCICDDGYRYCYLSTNGELVEKRKLLEMEALGMCHYPNRNEMLTYYQKGIIASWKI